MNSKADLHVHSKHSDRPSEWFLRRIGAPESFVEPLDLYHTCRARGMDYVTISDHNSINGALDIAHLPGTFLSSEITTYFPEDGCKIHCLVLGITEQWFERIQEFRPNIYDLQHYLNQEGIIHSIAHPLFRVNDRLTVEHVEKLILMFKRFEGVNGSRCPRAGILARAIFDHLTPDFIEQLADKHGIEPAGPEPWKKLYTGGSDDHSSLYSAGAHTVTPYARTVFDFLQHLRDGRHEPGGRAGTSLRLAHSLYHISYGYYRHRFMGEGQDGSLIGAMLKRLAGADVDPMNHRRSKGVSPLARLAFKYKKRKLNDVERVLLDEFTAMRDAGGLAGNDGQKDTAFKSDMIRKIGHQLSFVFIQRFMDQIKRGSLIESLQSLSSLGPVLLGVAPYLTAFGAQHKDEHFLQSVADRFPGGAALRQKTGKRAWVTDTFSDVNGVSHTIRKLAGLAHQNGDTITVITSLPQDPKADFPIRNFAPVGEFALPEYESQRLVFPPVLDVLEYIEEEGFDEIIISTPGPMGITAMAASKLLQLRVKGIYHTDFPQYVNHLTEDNMLEDITWRFMQKFYGDMDWIYVPSRAYLDQLLEKGFDKNKISILSRGVDLDRFNPAKRRTEFWERFGLNGDFKFLYVGRVSREKNIDQLVTAFSGLRASGVPAELVIVGDGPYLDELKAARHDGITFTGYLGGEDLAQAYASADVFVFPSRTDTFGNAVLEAHASGMPAIVSDEGGPAEIVQSHGSGLVVDTRSADALAEAMQRIRNDHDLRETLRKSALERAGNSSWEKALDQI